MPDGGSWADQSRDWWVDIYATSAYIDAIEDSVEDEKETVENLLIGAETGRSFHV